MLTRDGITLTVGSTVRCRVYEGLCPVDFTATVQRMDVERQRIAVLHANGAREEIKPADVEAILAPVVS